VADFVGMLRRVVFVWKFGQLIHILRYFHSYENQHPNFGNRAILAVTCFNFLLQTTQMFLQVILNATESGESRSAIFPASVTRVIWSLYPLWLYASNIMSKALILLLGARLIRKYKICAFEFRRFYRSRDREGIADFQDFLNCRSRFIKLEECFRLYGDLVGFLIAILILESTVIFLLGIFNTVDLLNTAGWSELELANYSCRFLEQFLTFFQLVHLGQYMKDEMEANNRELRLHAMVTDQNISNSNDRKVEEMANWIVSWNWQLTARNFCTIDFGLVPSVSFCFSSGIIN
jgi:hypothetical protein